MTDTQQLLTAETSAQEVDEEGGTADIDFGGLLDSYDYHSPVRGQILEGVVLNVYDDAVIVDVGVKRDAFVPRTDLARLDQATLDRLAPGASVMVYVLRPHNAEGDLIVSINKGLEHEDWQRADDLLGTGEVVDSEVTGTNSGGILVKFGRLRAFVPQSHLTSLPRGLSHEQLGEAKERLVGETLVLKVIDVDRRRSRLVLSERAARREARLARMAELEEGQVLTGRVAGLQHYGAFVDLGGVDGLVHVSELAHHRVEHPGDVLSVGDELEVMVRSVDTERERIGLSRKALLPSPWEALQDDYAVDDLVSGSVSNVVDFGAFVALPNGMEGLVHVSQMASYGISHPDELLHKGDDVLVRILEIDVARERMALSLDSVTSQEHVEWVNANAGPDEEGEAEPPGAGDEPDGGAPPSQPDGAMEAGEEQHVEEG